MVDEKRCAFEIDLSAFRENYRLIRSALPDGCRLMAVLKANAYGHGAVQLAMALEDQPEDWIAVATLGEALELRKAGVRKHILIMGGTDVSYVRTLAEQQLTQTVVSYDYGCALAGTARSQGIQVDVQLEVDTGMARMGLMSYGGHAAEELHKAVLLYAERGLRFSGIYTHFSSAYGVTSEDEAYTRLQYQRFSDFCGALEAEGITPGLRHCCNSPAILRYPEFALDMCRAGTILFGFLDQSRVQKKLPLQGIQRFRAAVMTVKELDKGMAVSYGRTAVTTRATRIAVVGAGWCDGYPRQMGNVGIVLIRGQRCRILGSLSMDSSIVDITGAPDVSVGDEAVFLGRQGDDEICASEVCAAIGLGPSSVSCGIAPRVSRIYRE